MTNENKLSQYHSFMGLHSISNSNYELQDFVKEIVNDLSKDEEMNSTQETIYLKFLDTFFSDTLTIETLRILFSLAKKKKICTQILILEPHSKFALSRSQALEQSAVAEITKALFMIRRALQSETSVPINFNKESQNFTNSEFITHQLERIREHELEIEIKFYDVLTETPVYIISKFLLKGLILPGRSAAENPWLSFINDKTQNYDIFDWLDRNFNTVWDGANLNPTL